MEMSNKLRRLTPSEVEYRLGQDLHVLMHRDLCRLSPPTDHILPYVLA